MTARHADMFASPQAGAAQAPAAALNSAAGAMQLDLDFVHTHSHRSDPETSTAAAKQAQHFVGEHHRIILDALADYGPLTGDEIAGVTKLDKWQVMRRVSELRRAGQVQDSGERRLTPKGCGSVVWRITKERE